MEESRKQFESEWAKTMEHLAQQPEMQVWKNVCWHFWESSRTAVEIELPDMNSKRYVEHVTDFDFLQYKMDLEDAIRETVTRILPKLTDRKIRLIFIGLTKQPFPDGALKMLRRQLDSLVGEPA